MYLLLKRISRTVLPPIVLSEINRLLGMHTRFHGNYKSWNQAISDSKGYQTDIIFQKVVEATRKIKQGEGSYERDGQIFYKNKYNWRLLTALCMSVKDVDDLRVVDFGGSLGSLYQQHFDFLSEIKLKKWNIVEQEQFVKCGNAEFNDERLVFHESIDQIERNHPIDILILSSVLQYIEEPYHQLEKLLDVSPRFVFIERTAYIEGNQDRLTVQRVPRSIYAASYPSWFFSQPKFLEFMSKRGYKMILDYENDEKVNIMATYKGFIFRLDNANI